MLETPADDQPELDTISGRLAQRDQVLGLVTVASPAPALIGSSYSLEAHDAVVGRGAEASIRIEDGGISRVHFKVVRGPDGRHRIHDLGSTNGTYLNGVRMRSALLAPGDRIQIGSGTEFLFGPLSSRAGEEIRLRQALAAAGAGAWEWDPATERLSLSGGIARDIACGQERNEPWPEDAWPRVHDDDRDALKASLLAALRAGSRCEIECRMVRADGSLAWVAMKGAVFAAESGHAARVAGTAMDVTERKRAELEMRRQSILLDSLSDGVVAVDFDGGILDWNARAEAMFGWSRAEVLGRRPGQVLLPGRADDLTQAVLERAARGERFAEERVLRRKDGREIAVEVVAAPLHDEDGKRLLACVAVLRDVDERRRMTAQLQVAERLASLGTLAAGVAHEINNPLAFISSNLSWARGRLSSVDPPLGAALADIDGALAECEEGAERIRVIVQDLRTHASGNALADGPGDVHATLEFALRMADGELRRRARVVKDLQPVPRVNGGGARLGQVFLNLITNAIQAIPSGNPESNEIRLRTRLDEAASQVVVEVEDTGSGIRSEDLDRIFDPFFTTKPVGSGTGLGLFICHAIVTALGGTIAAESRPGDGSTFRVRLPVPRPDSRRRTRVLFVDDDQPLASAVQRFLAGRHEVVVDSDPREVIRRLEAGEHFDAAVLPLCTREMSGTDLRERLRQLAPALGDRVIFTHGGTIEISMSVVNSLGKTPYLSKPFELGRLGSLLDSVLPAADEAAEP